MPLAPNQKQSRFLNKGWFVSFCDKFSTQALPGSQDKTEAKLQDRIYPKGYNYKNKKFNSYLAGLFEGDGHIWLPNIN